MSFCHTQKALSKLNLQIFKKALERNMASQSSSSFTNRLKLEKSPYLLQHATNPVEWYPWGEDAFQAAKEQNKLIFLSVGYSTCHWCHVMERESFENEEIAKIMNEHFINIKVDREERPDVDKVYMTFVTASSGRGGWPMSVFLTPTLIPVAGGTYFPPEDKFGRTGFKSIMKSLSEKSLSDNGGWPMSVWLTPDLKPIYGGTYYPPDDRYYGRPGFGSILTSIASQWKKNEKDFKESGLKILQVLERTTQMKSNSDSSLPSDESFAKAFMQLQSMYEPQYGGFSDAPKFPQPSNLNFLFAYKAFYPQIDDSQVGVDMALHTLQMMSKGGIHDHVSQGFARYSTDRQWHVPHFEKMLYDQAQLVLVYLDAFVLTKEQQYADDVIDIMTYVMRDLSHSLGGFYSAEDADSLPTADSEKKVEGAFCVWTHEEVSSLLDVSVQSNNETKLSDIFCHHYSVLEDGNVDPYKDPHDELKNQNVLIVHGSVAETASEFNLTEEECNEALMKCRQILKEVRLKRPRPHLDDKMVTAWNGMMLAATARAGSILNNQSYIDRAIKNANFIQNYVWKDNYLLRSVYKGDNDDEVTLGSEIRGFCDDYAWMVRGLIHLYNATLDDQWLRLAEIWQERQNELFWDPDGGYFMGPKDDASILLRIKDNHDGAEPCVNSVSAGNLVLLSRLLNQSLYEEKAVAIFKLFSERLEKVPVALPEMATALMLHLNPAEQIIMSGNKNSKSLKLMLDVIHTSSLNRNRTILVADTDKESSLLYSRHESLDNYYPKGDKELVYLCKDFACLLPSKTPQELSQKIATRM